MMASRAGDGGGDDRGLTCHDGGDGGDGAG